MLFCDILTLGSVLGTSNESTIWRSSCAIFTLRIELRPRALSFSGITYQ